MTKIFGLEGKTALVTGASSGLGRHFAVVLAGAGAKVAIGARRREKLAETADLIGHETGSEVCSVELDVTSQPSIKAAFDAAEERFGPVDIIVNNAGVSRLGFLLKLAEDDWDVVMATNLKSVWLVAAEGVRRMKTAGVRGSIVNIASILAFGVGKTLGPYMASKAGVVQLTRSMALEWSRYNIRVNAIAPGYFPTEMNEGHFETAKGQEVITGIPMQRTGSLEELAGPLLLLASDASGYMTGSCVTVDGGHLCRSL